MKFELTILGNSAAIPAYGRNTSAQVLNSNDKLIIIDCGEGTQFQLRKYKIKYQRIEHVFISHLHGDHYLGLTPLIFSFHLLGRTNELHVYANVRLEEIIRLQLQASDTTLRFPLIFHPIPEYKEMLLLENKEVSVFAFPLMHRIPTHGFLFTQKHSDRKINAEMIDSYQIPGTEILRIKQGGDFIQPNGNVIPNSVLTFSPPADKTYAYCSDTGYFPEIIPVIKKVDLLYHEATFMHDMVRTADEKQHSTVIQAAQIAHLADAKKLVLGHFSARYEDLKILREEAIQVFKNTIISEAGETYSIG